MVVSIHGRDGEPGSLLVERVETTSPLMDTVWSYLLVSSLNLSVDLSVSHPAWTMGLGRTVHLDLVARGGRDLFSAQLGVYYIVS